MKGREVVRGVEVREVGREEEVGERGGRLARRKGREVGRVLGRKGGKLWLTCQLFEFTEYMLNNILYIHT